MQAQLQGRTLTWLVRLSRRSYSAAVRARSPSAISKSM